MTDAFIEATRDVRPHTGCVAVGAAKETELRPFLTVWGPGYLGGEIGKEHTGNKNHGKISKLHAESHGVLGLEGSPGFRRLSHGEADRPMSRGSGASHLLLVLEAQGRSARQMGPASC